MAADAGRESISVEAVASGLSEGSELQREFELGSGPAAEKDGVEKSPSLLPAPMFLRRIFSGFHKIMNIAITYIIKR